jgi:hypothetical protein
MGTWSSDFSNEACDVVEILLQFRRVDELGRQSKLLIAGSNKSRHHWAETYKTYKIKKNVTPIILTAFLMLNTKQPDYFLKIIFI